MYQNFYYCFRVWLVSVLFIKGNVVFIGVVDKKFRLITPHSLRATSTTKTSKTMSVDTILYAGGSSCESTFRKHYDFPVM